MQINFYIYAIAFTCPKIHPGANYTYMYNLHTVCKSAHVNGAYDVTSDNMLSYCNKSIIKSAVEGQWPKRAGKQVVKEFLLYLN